MQQNQYWSSIDDRTSDLLVKGIEFFRKRCLLLTFSSYYWPGNCNINRGIGFCKNIIGIWRDSFPNTSKIQVVLVLINRMILNWSFSSRWPLYKWLLIHLTVKFHEAFGCAHPEVLIVIFRNLKINSRKAFFVVYRVMVSCHAYLQRPPPSMAILYYILPLNKRWSYYSLNCSRYQDPFSNGHYFLVKGLETKKTPLPPPPVLSIIFYYGLLIMDVTK